MEISAEEGIYFLSPLLVLWDKESYMLSALWQVRSWPCADVVEKMCGMSVVRMAGAADRALHSSAPGWIHTGKGAVLHLLWRASNTDHCCTQMSLLALSMGINA